MTGIHTFTTKTITKIETVLGEDIIYIEAQKEYVYFKVLVKDKEVEEEMVFEESVVFSHLDMDKKAS